MTDLNAIASNVNANAAKNGVNSDITALLALTTIAPGLTITGATISTSTINSSTLNIVVINGATIDGTTTGVTQPLGTNTTQLATTAFVLLELTLYAPLNSPAFTGIPTAPTAAPGTNTTQIATTAFINTGLLPYAPLNSPAFTGIPTAPTAPVGTNTNQLATMAALINQAFVTALPSQPGGPLTYRLITTNNTPSWTLDLTTPDFLLMSAGVN